MLPLKKILCPTDFSDPSFEALNVAIELAVHFSSELIVIHVVAPIPIIATEYTSPAAFNVQEYQQAMEVSARKSMEEQIEKRIPEGVLVRRILPLGDPANQIVHTAEDEEVDLIVIATRGQTGIKRLVFGSVAEKVVRLATRPVLTIRDRHS
ncbi:MAG: universal stress protein [Deltaproteobacteria bacterium]|nr:universal stress protein [Deltaproteobacteria bacterium]